MIKNNQPIVRETRFWDASSAKTISLREKETDVDYRFMPEPDLLPLVLTPERIEKVQGNLRELPDVTRNRFLQLYQVGNYEIDIILEHDVVDYFETIAKQVDPKKAASWYALFLYCNFGFFTRFNTKKGL